MTAPGTYACGDTVVEAMQWPTGESYDEVCQRAAIHRWVWTHDGRTWVTFSKANPSDVYVALETLAGKERIDGGDWIIRGALDSFYRCPPDTFADMWEPL